MQTISQSTPLDRLVQAVVDKSDAGAQSDIDLLVVMPDGTHRRQTAQRLYREIIGIGVPFDLVVTTRSDLERHAENRGLIYRAVLREGREVYAA